MLWRYAVFCRKKALLDFTLGLVQGLRFGTDCTVVGRRILSLEWPLQPRQTISYSHLETSTKHRKDETLEIRKSTIAIPIEHKEREFVYKCLLSKELADSGLRVFLGSTEAIDVLSKKSEPFLTLHKDPHSFSLKMQNLGHKFVYLDEETGLAISESGLGNEIAKRYGPFETVRPDLTLLPSERLLREIEKFSSSSGMKFEVTGWPRVDLWTPKYSGFFQPKKEEIKGKYGDFYLFPSTFGHASMEGTFLRDDPSESLGLARIKAFERYRKFLQEFSTLLEEGETLVIRPHPSEKPGAWGKLFRDKPRVKVVLDGDITPWILAAKGTLQYGSSTAVQSAYFGKTNVQLEPEPFPGITDTAPFAFAINVKNSAEAIKVLRNSPNEDNAIKRKATAWLMDNIAFSEEKSSVSRILTALKTESLPPIKRPKLSRRDKYYLSLQWEVSRVKYVLKRLKVMDDYYRTTYQKIPGGISASEVRQTVERFASLEKSNTNFSTVGVATNLVEIESV